MKKITNKDAWEYVRNREYFQGSNLRGEKHNNNYVVYSYFTPVIVIREDTPYKVFVTNKKYSQTTSRHISCCLHDSIKDCIEYVSPEELKDIRDNYGDKWGKK